MTLSNIIRKVPLTLGANVHLYRKRNEYTLVELAQQCNLSPSFLSQIERDQANPSVTTLYNIAGKLGIPVASFFEEAAQDNKNSQFNSNKNKARVVRADRRKVLIYPGSKIRNELLSPDLQRVLQMVWVVMPPGTDSGEKPFMHAGEECGIVLQGQIETRIGDEQYILGPGDTIYHLSEIPHYTRNISDIDAIMVVAKTSPSPYPLQAH